MGLSKFRLGDLIEPCEERNENLLYGLNSVKGISILKKFIETKADMEGVRLNSYKIVKRNEFAFNPNTARMGDKFAIAYNTTNDEILVSSIYPVFRVRNGGGGGDYSLITFLYILIVQNLIDTQCLILGVRRGKFLALRKCAT